MIQAERSKDMMQAPDNSPNQLAVWRKELISQMVNSLHLVTAIPAIFITYSLASDGAYLVAGTVVIFSLLLHYLSRRPGHPAGFWVLHGGLLLICSTGLLTIGPVAGIGANLVTVVALATLTRGWQMALVLTGVATVIMVIAAVIFSNGGGIIPPFREPAFWTRITVTVCIGSIVVVFGVGFLISRLEKALITERSARLLAEEACIERDLAAVDLTNRNRALNTILHTATHDLRNPVVTLSGFAHELQTETDALRKQLGAGTVEAAIKTLDGPLAESVGFMASAAEALSLRVNGLVELARLYQRVPQIRAIDVGSLCLRAHRLLDPLDTDLLQLEVGPVPRALGDPTWVEIVLLELLRNTVRHGAGLALLSGHQKGGTIEILIDQPGSELPGSAQEHAFNPFFQVNPAADGPGLGLTKCRILLESMNGTINLLSTAEGIRVLVQLPAPGPAMQYVETETPA